jgi:hypothetical protein
MHDPKKGTMTALVCPPGVWDLLGGVLMSRSNAYVRELRKQTDEALTQVHTSETNHSMFAFRVHSITVNSRDAMSQIVGRLASKGEVLVCVIPLPEDAYEICVREDQARALDEAADAAGQPEQLSAPHPVHAPDEHLEQAYEDRVSGPGEQLE